MKIAFVGLGQMDDNIVRRLLRGGPQVAVYTRSAAKKFLFVMRLGFGGHVEVSQ